MRVAVFSDVFPVAAESPFLNILTGLVRRGHEVDVFAERPQPRVAAHPDVAARIRNSKRGARKQNGT